MSETMQDDILQIQKSHKTSADAIGITRNFTGTIQNTYMWRNRPKLHNVGFESHAKENVNTAQRGALLSLTNITRIFPSNGLRLTNMSAPRIIDYTEDMTLECQFDMGDEELYSVKWYKDGNEFFRYMPHDQPHMKTFPVPGVYLEESLSLCGQDRCSVRLSNLVRVESSGAYQCEVSSEAPAFRLASETHNVTVAALPNENPSIEGVDESYFVGDILSAKCISPPTDPPQLLTWYINKEQVPNKLVRDMKTFKEDNRGLTTRSLLLRFAIEQKYSRGIPLELTCASAFAGVPETSRTVTKSISLFDHAAQILNNQKFSWNSSSFTIYDSCLILLLGALRWFLD